MGRAVNGMRKLVLVKLALLLASCSAGWNPIPLQQVEFLDRSMTQEQHQVRITAAVPSARETRSIFGADLYARGVQPVWLEIENGRADPVSFMPLGLDSDYFSPLETASMYSKKKHVNEMEQYFFSNIISVVIQPGETRSGFVFTHLDEGTKSFNVDVVESNVAAHFTFFIPVPGLKIDHYNVDFENIYPAEDMRELDEALLIAELEALPCCTTDAKSEGSGDPLNIVVVGEPKEDYYAFIRAGWDETEIVNLSSGLKTAASFLTGGEYRYSPVSSLYVFNRPQDVAFQRARENIHERNHLRLWKSPYTFGGETVWIGQISRDIGVRFTAKTITTHKIDPDVDETREFLLENLAYNQVLRKFAYVNGTNEATIDEPRGNLTGDPYFTDGLRAVFWIGSDSVPMDEIEFKEWEHP